MKILVLSYLMKYHADATQAATLYIESLNIMQATGCAKLAFHYNKSNAYVHTHTTYRDNRNTTDSKE